MPGASAVIGKTYAPTVYSVGREKIREYASAVGETDPVYHDLEAARAAGHRDLVAPPMFAVVYMLPAVQQPLFDPEVGIDFARLVHGGQEITWGPLVMAGDEISTTVTVSELSERAGLSFSTLTTVSINQDGETVSTGSWLNIVRGEGE